MFGLRWVWADHGENSCSTNQENKGPGFWEPEAVRRSGSIVGQARDYQLMGDTEKVRTAYQDLFALWKDAEPHIPILKEAKAEYAKLQ